jgi:hypothetical protein
MPDPGIHFPDGGSRTHPVVGGMGISRQKSAAIKVNHTNALALPSAAEVVGAGRILDPGLGGCPALPNQPAARMN